MKTRVHSCLIKFFFTLGACAAVLCAASVIMYHESTKTMAAGYEKQLPQHAAIDRIVVMKARRTLAVYQGGTLLKTYKVALGSTPEGHKRFEGDGKTPEGTYYVDAKNPSSRFYKNLGVSYPNAQDRAYAKEKGKSPGGDIKIHGLGREFAPLGLSHVQSDWTLGCIAVTNEEIDEIYAHTPVGVKIEIML